LCCPQENYGLGMKPEHEEAVQRIKEVYRQLDLEGLFK
jgi:hypothetical protein